MDGSADTTTAADFGLPDEPPVAISASPLLLLAPGLLLPAAAAAGFAALWRLLRFFFWYHCCLVGTGAPPVDCAGKNSMEWSYGAVLDDCAAGLVARELGCRAARLLTVAKKRSLIQSMWNWAR